MFDFLKLFYNQNIENNQFSDLSYNSLLQGNEICFNPDNFFFSPASPDELSFVLDCEKNNYENKIIDDWEGYDDF
ncbi:MAG: hypothetical protein Q8R58_03210 [Sulfuricurvum sp.]|nr:hypothetical protein [Sulfuricurvum sp.]